MKFSLVAVFHPLLARWRSRDQRPRSNHLGNGTAGRLVSMFRTQETDRPRNKKNLQTSNGAAGNREVTVGALLLHRRATLTIDVAKRLNTI